MTARRARAGLPPSVNSAWRGPGSERRCPAGDTLPSPRPSRAPVKGRGLGPSRHRSMTQSQGARQWRGLCSPGGSPPARAVQRRHFFDLGIVSVASRRIGGRLPGVRSRRCQHQGDERHGGAASSSRQPSDGISLGELAGPRAGAIPRNGFRRVPSNPFSGKPVVEMGAAARLGSPGPAAPGLDRFDRGGFRGDVVGDANAGTSAGISCASLSAGQGSRVGVACRASRCQQRIDLLKSRRRRACR